MIDDDDGPIKFDINFIVVSVNLRRDRSHLMDGWMDRFLIWAHWHLSSRYSSWTASWHVWLLLVLLGYQIRSDAVTSASSVCESS